MCETSSPPANPDLDWLQAGHVEKATQPEWALTLFPHHAHGRMNKEGESIGYVCDLALLQEEGRGRGDACVPTHPLGL